MNIKNTFAGKAVYSILTVFSLISYSFLPAAYVFAEDVNKVIEEKTENIDTINTPEIKENVLETEVQEIKNIETKEEVSKEEEKIEEKKDSEKEEISENNFSSKEETNNKEESDEENPSFSSKEVETLMSVSIPENYGAYCGDDVVNQTWESCDGTTGCTAQCQIENVCNDKVFGKIVTDVVENTGTGNASADAFIGGGTNSEKIPGNTWFLVNDSASPVIDSDINGYSNVPGYAVERQNGKIRIRLYGRGGGTGQGYEHVDGHVELYNAPITTVTNDFADPHMDTNKPFTNVQFAGRYHTDDALALVSGQVNFWLTTTSGGDTFFVEYGNKKEECAEVTVIKNVINDNGGTKIDSDFSMNLQSQSGDFVFPGSANGTTYKVQVGQFSIYESSNFGGYNGTMSGSCYGILNPNDSVTCIITNDDNNYGAYCGDGIVNQSWEICDGTTGCNTQCQMEDICSDKVFARINTDTVENTGTGNATSDVFLGGNALVNKIPGTAWFLVKDGMTPVIDGDLSTYSNVPGYAVERQADQIRVRLHGRGGGTGKGYEHADGYIEFANATGVNVTNDISAGPNMDTNKPFTKIQFAGRYHTDDALALVSGQVKFWLTTTSGGDTFFAHYGEQKVCDEIPQ